MLPCSLVGCLACQHDGVGTGLVRWSPLRLRRPCAAHARARLLAQLPLALHLHVPKPCFTIRLQTLNARTHARMHGCTHPPVASRTCACLLLRFFAFSQPLQSLRKLKACPDTVRVLPLPAGVGTHYA